MAVVLDSHWLLKGDHPPFVRCCFLPLQVSLSLSPLAKPVRSVGLVTDNPTMGQIALGIMHVQVLPVLELLLHELVFR